MGCAADRGVQGGCAVAEKDARLRRPRWRGLGASCKAVGPSLALAFIVAASSMAQTNQQFPIHQQQQERTSDVPGESNDRFPSGKEKQLRSLNAQRQKSLVSDAERLLQLATELNAEVSAGNSDSLTPSELRKVAAIEKLARSVKQKMSLAVGGGLDYRDPFLPPNP